MVRSKEQEIEILKRWQAEAYQEPGSYLATFMRPELVGWVISEIQVDGCPSPWTEIVQAEENANELKAENRRLDAGYRLVTELLEKTKSDIENLQDLLRTSQERSTERQQEIHSLGAEVENLRTKLMIAQTEVNRLKVKLWDMHEAKTAAEYTS